MSGGHWDYKQHDVNWLAEDLYRTIARNGQVNEFGDLFTIPEDLLKIMKETYISLRKCSIQVNRLDWWISGDDSVENFWENLEEDNAELEEELKNETWTLPEVDDD